MHLLAFVPHSFLDSVFNNGPMLRFYIIELTISYVVTFFFILTCWRLVKCISKGNRKISPATVWWMAFPLIAGFFMLICVPFMSKSIELEYMKRGSHLKNKATLIFGLIAGSLGSVGVTIFIVSNFILLPKFMVRVDAVMGICGWLAIIIYWVLLNNHLREFKQPYTNDSPVFGVSA